MRRLNNEFNKNINLWESLGKSDPLWGILTDKRMKNNKWDKDNFFNTGLVEINQLINNLELLGIRKEMEVVLDFGCGVGRLTKHLSLKFKQVLAFDISYNMLKTAKDHNKGLQNALFIQSYSRQLASIKANKINLIISLITFQHIPTYLQLEYLSGFARVLSNEGIIFLQVVHGFTFNPKGILLYFFGNNLLKINQKLRYNLEYPIKIYTLKKQTFYNALSKNKMEILQKEKSNSTGNAFKSYIYILRIKK